jgi:hypothetical protein
MSTVPPNQDVDLEQDADRQADEMKAQLRKDVASWSQARGETSQQLIAAPSPPAARQSPSRPVARPRKPKASVAAVKPTPSSTKPFSMSYDGGSTADYIQYMIDRGAR